MSELRGRMSFEREFFQRMLAVNGKLRARLAQLLGNPPDWRRVPETFWVDVKRSIQEDALLAILLITASSAQQHGLDLPGVQAPTYDDYARDPRVVQYAQQRADELAQGFSDRTRQAVQQQADPFRQQAPAEAAATPADIADSVLPNSRIETLAITETTTARQGGANVAMAGREAPGDTWRTELDASVCPICAPLHGTKRPVWSLKFPAGPPAHPRCRCEIVFEAEGQGPAATSANRSSP